VSVSGFELTVPATPEVRALLGDWLCRTLLPLWLFAAGLDQEAVRCRGLPQVTAALVDSPGRLRPLATVLARVHLQASAQLSDHEQQQPALVRPWLTVGQEVLGSSVWEAASTAQWVFTRSRVGRFGHAALVQCVADAALVQDAAELVSLQHRTGEQFWGLLGALSRAGIGPCGAD